MKSVFVCHSSKDKWLVRRIAKEVGRFGVRVWLALALLLLVALVLIAVNVFPQESGRPQQPADRAEAGREGDDKMKYEKVPFEMAPGLFDHSKRSTLGLTRVQGAETFTIFAPNDNHADRTCMHLPFCPKYNHGVRIESFGGGLIAFWRARSAGENSPDGMNVYSVSKDNGETWSPPKLKGRIGHAQPGQNVRNPGEEPRPRQEVPAASAASGWVPPAWHSKGQPYVLYEPRYYGKGSFWAGPGPRRTEYTSSTDGVHWAAWQFLRDNKGNFIDGYVFAPTRLSDGRLIVVDGRMTDGGAVVSAPFYTDDPAGIKGWTRAERKNLPPAEQVIGREIEASSFRRADGGLVTVFRDQMGAGYILASMSMDRGESWTPVVGTNMFDLETNQTAGNLPDGTAFIVNHPTTRTWCYPGSGQPGHGAREMLVITLSRDGRLFDRSYLIRGIDDLQPQRYEGSCKDPGYSYPTATVIGDYMYVAYAANKEDAQVTRIPLKSLTLK